MGILDSFVDSYFKEDGTGKKIYFPWGPYASGVIINTAETEEKIRKFIKVTIGFTAMAAIVLMFLFTSWWNLTIVPVYLIWFFLGNKKLTNGLARSTEKLRFAEIRSIARDSQARNLGWFWIGFMVFFVFIFLWASIWKLTIGNQPYYGIFGIAASLFGALFLFQLVMLKLRLSKAPKD